MATTLAELRIEVYGPYSYLNDSGVQAARADRWINQAYHELCDQAPWTFLETSTSGTAPLTISDLGAIISVTDVDGVALDPIQYDPLRRVVDGDITVAGNPGFYYITGTYSAMTGASTTAVNTYPVPASSISVRYRMKPTNLASGGDTPLVPDEYRDIIALGALRRAAIDNQAWEAANGYRQEWDARLLDMVSAEIEPPRKQQIVAGSEDQ